MVYPASLLALLALLIASVLSAPIHIPSAATNSVHINSRSVNPDRHSSLLLGHLEHNDHPKRDALKPSLSNPNDLESRSFRPIAEEKHVVSESKPTLSRRSLWSKFKKSVKKVGHSIGRGIKKAARTVRKVAHAVRKVAKKVVHAAKKAVRWVKTNGAKIAKVGLKSMAALSKAASHVAAVIPGVGKPIGLALSNFSKSADFAQQQIHVSLGSKLDKYMKVMDRIQHPLGTGAAGKILDAVLKRDVEEQRLYERDLYERGVDSSFHDNIQRAAGSLRYLKDA